MLKNFAGFLSLCCSLLGALGIVNTTSVSCNLVWSLRPSLTFMISAILDPYIADCLTEELKALSSVLLQRLLARNLREAALGREPVCIVLNALKCCFHAFRVLDSH